MREMGPKACAKQASADPRGSRTCVCANTFEERVSHAGGEGRINVLPWYRPVGVAKYLQLDAEEEEPGCPHGYVVATWYGDESPHLSLPDSPPLSAAVSECARLTGKVSENGQNSGGMGGSSPWTRPSAPACGDTSKASASASWIWDEKKKGGSRVAIDWVTGRWTLAKKGDGSMYSEAYVSAWLLALSRATRVQAAWTRSGVRLDVGRVRSKSPKTTSASMDTCHLKNLELEPKFPKYSGRVVLRGDIVKDDSGSFAVPTEQGSSASQMTPAKVMDIVSKIAWLHRTSSSSHYLLIPR